MLYARYIGYTIKQIFELSQDIIVHNDRSRFFAKAYEISYTDVYDFASAANKKSLKKFEIELGIHHKEFSLPFDQEVPEDRWDELSEYCCNDVRATEKVFYHLKPDWEARKLLAKITGLTVNHTTNSLSEAFIFGNNRNPQDEFIYTDLSGMFPGYHYAFGKSTYWDEDPGEGGYVYSEPGMYKNIALLDVESMHPNSLIQLEALGKRYTARFKELLQARIAVKHKDIEALKELLSGAFYDDMVKVSKEDNFDEYCKNLSNALKTVINSVYGLTSAKFPNRFKDPRNVDNIVAKRGALFMINLKHFVQDKGFTVAHIKTDSIKIPDATSEIIEEVMEFGRKYGYKFEHEATYEKMCLVNKAVYIAKTSGDDAHWTATGEQFAQPYVFKTLFSKEKIEFKDKCETRSVTTAMYLDMNENLKEDKHDYVFVGRVGSFCPIKPGCGGGVLLRRNDDKYDAVNDTKGYRWLESEMVEKLHKEDDIDESYYKRLVDAAVSDISKYGDFEWFTSDEKAEFMNVPETNEDELPFN